MKRSSSLVLLLGFVSLAARPAAAFVLAAAQSPSTKQWYPLRWPATTHKVRFVVSDRPLELLPNLTQDSTPIAAVQAALQSWAIAPPGLYLDGMDSRSEAAKDGVNLISFADTPKNRDTVGDANGITLWWLGSRPLSQPYWPIVETDIIITPKRQWSTNGESDKLDVQSTVTHELGHVVGLGHTPIVGATMTGTGGAPGQTHRRILELDDIAGMRTLYGLPDPDRGALAGKVITPDAAPVFGAHVVAVDVDGVIPVSAVTEEDGSFTLPSLSPGSYSVYVEPLDGPITAKSLINSDRYRNIQTQFQTTIVGNLDAPGIRVEAEQTTTIDPITVPTQPGSLNPLYAGQSASLRTLPSVTNAAVPIPTGSGTFLAVVGPGLGAATSIRVTGSDVILNYGQVRRGRWSGDLYYLFVPMAVRREARPGVRSVLVQSGGEIAAYTGGIKVVAR